MTVYEIDGEMHFAHAKLDHENCNPRGTLLTVSHETFYQSIGR